MTRVQSQLFGGDWTERKLDTLSEYLERYSTALKKQPFRRVYLDAFAGTGYREQRKTQFRLASLFDETDQEELQRFLKGSAKRALEVEPPFDHYVFVESSPSKVAELERLRQEHPGKASAMQIEMGDANEFVREYCRCQDWKSTRAVLFLDPFATQVEWRTIEAVARTCAIDTWILLPLMAVNRLLAHDPGKACGDRLDIIFGTHDWFQRFYHTTREGDIFGQSLSVVKKACDFGSVGDFYQERLKSIFAGVAPNPHVITNSRGSPLFQLCFAVGNQRGAPIAVRIANHLLENM